jgi:hypothetical protein
MGNTVAKTLKRKSGEFSAAFKEATEVYSVVKGKKTPGFRLRTGRGETRALADAAVKADGPTCPGGRLHNSGLASRHCAPGPFLGSQRHW